MEAQNVVLLGPPGTGKTHLATALGIVAARQDTERWSPPRRTGSPSAPRLVLGDWTSDFGYHVGSTFDFGDEVTAAFASNEEMTLGLQ